MMKKRSDVSVFRFPGSDHSSEKQKTESVFQAMTPFFVPDAEPTLGNEVVSSEDEFQPMMVDKGKPLELDEPVYAPMEIPEQLAEIENTDPADIESEIEVGSETALAGVHDSTPPSTSTSDQDNGPKMVQQVLDEMYSKGVELGREEGRSALEQEIRQQAMVEGRAIGDAEGREVGYEEGLNKGSGELERRLSIMQSMNQELEDRKQVLNSEQVVLAARLLERLAMEVVRAELKNSPEQIGNLVREATRIMEKADNEHLNVRVNPADIPWLEELIQSSAQSYVLVPDESISRGGCRIEGSLSEIDATLEKRMEDGIHQLRSFLLDKPENAPPVDLSPVLDDINAPDSKEALTFEKFKPDDDYASVAASVNRENQVKTRGAVPTFLNEQGHPDQSMSAEPDDSLSSGLGAWGSLGQ